jgi:hypothetical protein
MTVMCPAGHASDESDYCSVCGAPIPASAIAAGTPRNTPVPRPASSAGGCPVCGEPRTGDDRFCEVCRYDFVARAPGPAPAAAPAPAPVAVPAAAPAPAPAPSAAQWSLVVTIDATLDVDPDPAAPPPTGEPERVFPIELAEMLVGRRDDKQNIRPAIPLHDPGASRRHAKFLLGADGKVSLHDLASTNGTQLNGADVVSGSITPLKDGDQVTLGRWTRITLKARP